MRSNVSDETRRILIGRKAALTSISSHPNWPELEAEVERKTKRIEKLVLAKTLGGGVVNEQELYYLRGFIHGMRWFASVPTNAERTLESFLKEQGVHSDEEA